MLSTLIYIFKYREKMVDRTMLYVSLGCVLVVLLHLGYIFDADTHRRVARIIVWLFYGLFVLGLLRLLFSVLAAGSIGIAHYGGFLLAGCFLLVALGRSEIQGVLTFMRQDAWLYLGVFAVFLTELSKNSLFFDNFYFNPTILFVISFLVLILAGTLLLMLPRTTWQPLPFVDALFISTSAVCITGLSTVDIATRFTGFGHAVILVLIQMGALGMMTFTGFFGYFFAGGFSYKNQLMYSEFLGQNKVGSVVNTLLKIIFVTLVFEAFGAIFIFFSVDPALFSSAGERLFFSVFHAVSAFCNAGFSLAEGGLGHPLFRYNYQMQLIVAALFIVGGLGFGIVFNIYSFAKHWLVNIFRRIVHGRPFVYRAWDIGFNTRLVVWTTFFLFIVATVLTFLFEHDLALADHRSFFGKWIAAFFMGNSARTAGFSLAETGGLSSSTLLVMMFLMWIGASPGSTGGGIKTTTFSVAVLNVFNLARGRDSVEIFGRRISNDSITKSFAIILLSFLVIGITVVALSATDGEKGLWALAFESLSAYATCGLSVGITPQLSDAGKVILICCMFTGRVGMLTLLVALIKNTKNRSYEYPQEKVLF